MILIPAWLYILPKNAQLDKHEFAKALGIGVKTLESRIYKGYKEVPPPCRKMVGANKTKHYWTARVVRNYIRQLNRGENERKIRIKQVSSANNQTSASL